MFTKNTTIKQRRFPLFSLFNSKHKKKEVDPRIYSQKNGIWQEQPRLSYMIPWAYIDETNGIVHNHDHSMMAIFKFRGLDTASSTPEELIAYNAAINNAMRRLPSGYILYIEAQRHPSHNYERSTMPNPTLQAIEDAKATYFESGHFYESDYYFTIYMEPPSKTKHRLTSAFVTNGKNKGESIEDDLAIYKEVTDEFIHRVNQFALMLKSVFKELSALLDPDEIATFLHSLISDRMHRVKYNPLQYLNEYLSDASITGGLKPQLGTKPMRVITLLGFPISTIPGLLDTLNALNIQYRWTSRWHCIGTDDAKKFLIQRRKDLKFQAIGVGSRLGAIATKRQVNDAEIDDTELSKANDVTAAIEELGTGMIAQGYYTMTLCVFANDVSSVEKIASHVLSIVNQLEFTGYIETDNSMEAWRGSLPGCPRCNIRRNMVNSLNFCHLAPTTAQWSGDKWNDHLKGPVLLYTDSYNSQFRLSLHNGALAHTLVCGPSGSGKSVLLNTLEVHFMKYPNSRIFVFDKAASSRVTTYAAGGNFYNISASGKSDLSFQPLENVDIPTERVWAIDWLAGFLDRGKFEVTESTKDTIKKALLSLAEFPKDKRTISNFCDLVQDTAIRIGLRALTMEGPYGPLFDNHSSIKGSGRWQVYEMEEVMRTPAIVPSTIDYLFHQIDNALKEDSPSPTMIILDECWLFFDNPVFRDKIREYFKDLRKKNASIIVATQNLADIISKPDLLSTILENCPNRIYLRNQNAVNEQIRNYYHQFGCNERQIDIISKLDNQERHEYYYSSFEKGNRVFDLALQPIEAAFVLSTDKSDQIYLNKLIEEKKMDNFTLEWLIYKGLYKEAEFIKAHYL